MMFVTIAVGRYLQRVSFTNQAVCPIEMSGVLLSPGWIRLVIKQVILANQKMANRENGRNEEASFIVMLDGSSHWDKADRINTQFCKMIALLLIDPHFL